MSECAVESSIGQPTAMTASIFISYASKDRAAAHTICDALEHRGFNCWIADRDIGPGENFQVSIVHAIRSAKAMILVFSANAANSEEIKKEIVLAGQSRLVVIPVRVEDVAPDEAFAYEMATRQWIDLFGDWEQSVQRLARQLETVTHIKPGLTVAASTPAAEQGPGAHKGPLTPSFPEPAAGSPPPSKPAAPSPRKLDWRLIAAPGGTAAVIAAVLALWLSLGHSNSSVSQPNLPVSQAVGEVELQKGWEAFQRRDYAEAMRWDRKAADQGNAQAQNRIGWLYQNGLGVARDYVEAMRWYRMAADHGNVPAQAHIGWLYQNGWGVAQDSAEARIWMQKAAAAGDDYAKRWLASRQVSDLPSTAASVATSPAPEVSAAEALQKGNQAYERKDYAQAMRWYRVAADQGNAQAQSNIGILYEHGLGVAQDSAEARAWMQKAAAAGDDYAKRWLVSHQAPS
jgi:TPR repeat protein